MVYPKTNEDKNEKKHNKFSDLFFSGGGIICASNCGFILS
jgi:hypothetical protein